MDLKDLRREYLHGGLRSESLNADPLVQFNGWLDNAVAAKLIDPTAMTLATVDAMGQPSQRIVLLKQADRKGFVFYTNFDSKKGQDIAQNSKVSMHFAWLPLERQVKIQGVASKLSEVESLEYFTSRPRESQLGAWCSAQSHVIASRQQLEAQFIKMKHQFSDRNIPLPDFWGGYRIEVHKYEFWQGGANRLHDSFSFIKGASDDWQIDRLAP